MPVYSHSRLTTFEQCPKKFYFRYVKRPDVPEFKGIEMFLGSVAHKALENLYRALLVSKVPAKEDVVKDYHSVWEKEWGDDVTIVKEQYTADDYRRTGERCVADYYDKHHPFDGEGRILGLEENVRFALDDAGQYRMQGVIDRLMEPKPREVEIHDYKSSMRLPSQDDMEKDRQLALYGIGVRQTMPDVGRVEFVWHYLVFGREIRVSPTPAKVEDTRRWAVSTIRRIEREETFEPRESVLCNWCDFQSVCPAKNPAPPKVTPERREALKEGAALVDKWEELEGRRKTLEKEIDEAKERLRELAESCEIDSFEGAEKAAMVRHKEYLAAPTIDSGNRAPLEEFLRREGLWEEFSELKHAALNKAFLTGRFDDRLQKRIEKLLDRRDEWKISLKKKG